MKRSLPPKALSNNPMIMWEEMLLSYGWIYEKPSSYELIFSIDHFAHSLEVTVRWHESFGSFEILGAFNIEVPKKKKMAALELISALNHEIRLGCFYLCPFDQRPLFKATFLSFAPGDIKPQHLSELMEELLFHGEKLLQALQMVFKNGHPVSEVIFAAFVEVGGEA